MSSFYSKFLEDANPDYDPLIEDFASCGLAFPSLASTSGLNETGFAAIDEWISSKDFYNSRLLNQIHRKAQNPQIAELLDDYEICNTQRLLPVCIEDLIYRCKTPKWTRNSLILKHLGDRLVGSFCRDFRDDKTKKLTRKEALDYMSGTLYSAVHTPDYVEAAAFDQITDGAGNENPYLNDCLAIIKHWPEENSHLVVYPDGRDHESLRISDLRISIDRTDKFIHVSVKNQSPTIHLGAEILQVEFSDNHERCSTNNNRAIICRTSKNLQLVTISENLDVRCEIVNAEDKLATFCQNPYFGGEVAILNDKSELFISSLETKFSSVSATKLAGPLDIDNQQDIYHRLCWSDHPRQIFALKNNHLQLIDLRDRNSVVEFWSQNLSRIHTIERFDCDSKYLLLTNDRSAFIVDQRQTGRSVFDFHHNLLDQPSFTAVSNSLQKNKQSDQQRLFILCSRQLNDIFWTPLVWCQKSMSICQGMAPRIVPSLSDNVEWFKCRRPLSTCTTSFQKRCQAPVRGLKLISNALNENDSTYDVALILNDVGDLGYATFCFRTGSGEKVVDSTIYDRELDAIRDFMQSRSSIYMKNKVPEKSAEFLGNAPGSYLTPKDRDQDRSILLNSMNSLSMVDDRVDASFNSSQQDLFEKHPIVENSTVPDTRADDDNDYVDATFDEYFFLCHLKGQISSDLSNLMGNNVDDNGKIVLGLWNSDD